MSKKFEAVIVPSLQREIERIKDKKQVQMILKSFRKIETHGKNALDKILYVKNQYLVTEIKFKRPPYRLYVIVDQSVEKFYMVKWEHKKVQQKVIEDLKMKLEAVFSRGIRNISQLFER